MDLAFTPEEQQFRLDIRAWVRDQLPADIAHKVHNALQLSREDMQRWGQNLAGRAGTRYKNTCLKKNAPWPVHPGSCPLAR